MVQEGFKRKLTAILSADVKGYSRLMDKDEDTTVRTLKTCRELISRLIRNHQGRVVDSPGDNLLAEFVSVVDAVQCAVEVQKELKVKNADAPENRRMEFRIGVHLGDVIEDEKRIYGDGVNIAARLEGLAEGGGICISAGVYEQIKNKLSLGYEFLGARRVKNLAEPIKAYHVLLEPEAAGKVIGEERSKLKRWRWAAIGGAVVLIAVAGAFVIWNYYIRLAPSPVEVASKEKMAFPLPDKPSIAVLPFVNISGDPEQEYFSDGITEDLITDLSKISGLFIIARTSTFAYKGKPVKIRQVAEELGVRYVLEGSVRKAQDQVRINAQLIDATTGHHLWAERYDGKLDDVFALQDKVTQKIVSALAVQLTGAERKHVLRRETDNILAYDAYLKGSEHYHRFTPDDLTKAVSYFKKAIEIEPNYGRAYAAMALVYWRAYAMGWHWSLVVGWSESRLWARQYLQMAMKKPTSLVHQLASQMNLYQRLYKEAIAEAQQAIDLDPNDPSGLSVMSEALIFEGRAKEAIDFVQSAMRLDPHNPALYFYLGGLAHFNMGQLEEAVELIDRALTLRPEAHVWANVLSAAYGYLGRYEEAQSTLGRTQMGRASYKGDLRRMMYFYPFKDPVGAERMMDGFLKLGAFGQRSGYYKVFEENKLTGDEIKVLVFDRRVAGSDGVIDRTKDGKATIQLGLNLSESGTSWIERDMLCNQWQTLLKGLKDCAPVYRNPEGTPDGLDRYFAITDYGFATFSPVD